MQMMGGAVVEAGAFPSGWSAAGRTVAVQTTSEERQSRVSFLEAAKKHGAAACDWPCKGYPRQVICGSLYACRRSAMGSSMLNSRSDGTVGDGRWTLRGGTAQHSNAATTQRVTRRRRKLSSLQRIAAQCSAVQYWLAAAASGRQRYEAGIGDGDGSRAGPFVARPATSTSPPHACTWPPRCV